MSSTNGNRLRGVRIDSGDLLSLAREVRRIFDEAGLTDVKIIGSGGLDEYDLDSLSQANAPYDSYGVGTRMGVSADAPWFDIAYKLVEHNGRPVLKLSTGKVSSPAKKTGLPLCGRAGPVEEGCHCPSGGGPSRCRSLAQKGDGKGKDDRDHHRSKRDQGILSARIQLPRRSEQGTSESRRISSRTQPSADAVTGRD